MRFTKEEKKVLLELLDCVTNNSPEETIKNFHDHSKYKYIWRMYYKLRVEFGTYYLQDIK